MLVILTMCCGKSGSLGIFLRMASWITGEPFVLTMFCFALCYGGPTWILLLVLELDCYLGGSNAFLGSPVNLCHDETGTQSVCVGSLQALHSLLHPTSSLGLQQRIFITYQRVSPCTCNAQSSTKDQPWIPFPTNSSRLDLTSVSFY